MKVSCSWYTEPGRCINADKACWECSRNDALPRRQDYCFLYVPTCRFGYGDCIGDPAYIKFYHEEWYHDLYGDMTPEEAALKRNGCAQCEDGDQYDDEDK